MRFEVNGENLFTSPVVLGVLLVAFLLASWLLWKRPSAVIGLSVLLLAIGTAIVGENTRPVKPTGPQNPSLNASSDYRESNELKVRVWQEQMKTYERELSDFQSRNEITLTDLWERRLGVICCIVGLAFFLLRGFVWVTNDK